jgi:hypothetical protein
MLGFCRSILAEIYRDPLSICVGLGGKDVRVVEWGRSYVYGCGDGQNIFVGVK